MSYLVLARKWRPKRFAELVGQEHVVRALSNALQSGRVHHAFLFTGTRGVGKTTIARIFSKSLNCEQGTSADPCGECNACRDIDAGRFVDLLEIDAASNTGVDDVRELIENAQYLPSRGRTKVYLIDEVHMLSKSAFNALLKTLEEPPEHVKFLLATTDPQKLPVTVLSRCLQFNLRRLEQAQILGQMEKILAAEGIAYEPAALQLLARGADGSLRDGLSLLDQAIAYSGGQLTESAVVAMLGTVDRAFIGLLLQALADGDGPALMAGIEQLASFSPDFAGVLDDLSAALHAVQVKQLVPGVESEIDRVDVAGLAASIAPEVVQLWYQMGLAGRRDLPYAPSPRAGFEMTLLRMLAFRPSRDAAMASKPMDTTSSRAAASSVPVAKPAAAPKSSAMPYADANAESPRPVGQSASPRTVAEPSPAAPVVPAVATMANGIRDSEAWLDWVAGSGLKGPALALASHAGFVSHHDGVLRLALGQDDAHLNNPGTLRALTQALALNLGHEPRVLFEAGQVGDTHQARVERQRVERQSGAHQEFLAHPAVGRLLAEGGVVNPESIRPFAG